MCMYSEKGGVFSDCDDAIADPILTPAPYNLHLKSLIYPRASLKTIPKHLSENVNTLQLLTVKY